MTPNSGLRCLPNDIRQHRPHFLIQQLTPIAVAAFILGCSASLCAAPRTAWPPWPEETLASYRFNDVDWHPPFLPPAIGFENAYVQESWSEYALIRDGLSIAPVLVPNVDTSGRDTFAPAMGSVRFWFCPAWTSSIAGGNGPGSYARLLEVVDLVGAEPSAQWSLYLAEDGNTLYLSGVGSNGKAKDLLTSPASFLSGQWELITLNYGPEGSQLWAGDELLAEGRGIPKINQWEDPVQALVIGSDLAVTAPAVGQFEEFTIFDCWLDQAQLQFYFKGVSRQVFRGTVGTPEEEAAKEELLAALFPQPAVLLSQGGGTRTAYSYSSNDLWLEITGVTNSQANFVIHAPSSAPYDLFMTTNLSATGTGLNVTNWTWEMRANSGETNVSVPTDTNPLAFYRLGTTNDADDDGLTDAFENLVSHSDPSDADTDGDTLPDGWEWLHFGGFDQSPTNDYDGDSVSNWDEFDGGTDPNTIAFRTQFDSLYVNTNLVQATLDVQLGSPAEIAVLVNTTNLSGNDWQSYSSSNITVALGPSDGDYEVWIVLRGRAGEESDQTWEATSLTLDRVAPVLTITNPASSLVIRPYIQLQGYAEEELEKIEFDVVNTNGVMTNMAGFVTDDFFDTNLFRFTTHYFQCYDVALTEGTNAITLRASDLAGNVGSTNVVLTLDYATATNPPVLEVICRRTERTSVATVSTFEGRSTMKQLPLSLTSWTQMALQT